MIKSHMHQNFNTISRHFLTTKLHHYDFGRELFKKISEGETLLPSGKNRNEKFGGMILL